MGYYSNYDGCYEPTRKLTDDESNKILQWFKDRFGDYSVIGNKDDCNWYCDDCRIESPKVDGTIKHYLGDIFYDPQSQEVWPVSLNMKGYGFNNHIYEFVTFINGIGIAFYGDVERDGEESDDWEKIAIENGKVMSYKGEIIYNNPIEFKETEAEKRERFNKMFATNK